MKIFLDDIRNPPDNTWIVVRNFKDCFIIVDTCLQYIDVISFDHDLGDEYDNGNDIALLIESKCMNGFKCPNWIIHSSNPVGRQNIQATMESAKKIIFGRSKNWKLKAF